MNDIEKQYFKERVDDQINWYDKKSSINKKWFTRLRTIQIILSAAIPVLVSLITKIHFIPLIISIIGATVTVLESTASLFKFHENWIEYRTTAEQLKHEKYAYINSSGVYQNDKGKFNLLVTRCENIFSSESVNWTNINNIKGK